MDPEAMDNRNGWLKKRGVIIIVVGNEHGDNEFKSWTRLIAFSHSTNTLGKGMNPIILPPAMGK